MRKHWWRSAVLLATFCFVLNGCSETKSGSNDDDYADTKKIIVDVLKTDEGKKAIQEILADKSVKAELIMDQETITKTIEKTLSSDKEKQFWEEAFKDPQFVKAFTKGMKSSYKKLMTDLMKDPTYTALLMDILKDPEMEKEYAKVMNSKDFRKELQTLITEALENPIYQSKIQDIITKASKEKKSDKESNKEEEKS